MAYTRNPSVLQFKRDMQDLQNRLAVSVDKATEKMTDELIGNMRLAAPKRTGTLAASIHKKRVVERVGDIERVAYLVIGGGKQTTKRTPTGHSYDYAVGTEFGTQKEAAEPYFYSSARRYFNYFEGGILESVNQVVDNNNRARGLRAENEQGKIDADFSRVAEGPGHAVEIKGPQL